MKKHLFSTRRQQLRKFKKVMRRKKYKIVKSKIRNEFGVVDVLYKDEYYQVKSVGTVINPPKIFCLNDNTLETTRFLFNLRNRLKNSTNKSVWVKEKNGKNRKKTIGGYVDFSKIKTLSTSAALVLAAEYQRVCELIGSPPPLINLHDWERSIISKLSEIGFFRVLGITKSEDIPLLSDQSTMTLQFTTGRNAGEAEKADEMLMQLMHFLREGELLPKELLLHLNTALSEAMVNVAKHAYPDNFKAEENHQNRFWLSGSADRSNRTLTVCIYDSGATIPVTYNYLKRSDKVLAWLENLFLPTSNNEYSNDGILIEAAARFGSSQTGLSYRGKGLPDMQKVIDYCGNGHLLILSRGGKYIYTGATKSSRMAFDSPLSGTLIEWSVQLPS